MSSETEQNAKKEKSNRELVKLIKKGNENNQMNISYVYLFKVSLIGDSGTGKKSIITRFIDNVFKEDTTTIIGVDFKIVSFDLGDNIFAKMQTCSAFILVFDLTHLLTFKNVGNWIKIIKENIQHKYILLIGNKSDLTEQREIQNEEIINFCEENNLNYIEISAKNNDNIESIFKEVAAELFSEIKRKKNDNEQSSLGEFLIGGFKNIKIGDETEDKQGTDSKKPKWC